MAGPARVDSAPAFSAGMHWAGGGAVKVANTAG